MPLALQTAVILRALINHADACSDVQTEIVDFSGKIAVKQLKSKAVDLAKLKKLRSALSGQDFKLLLESLSLADLKSTLKKVDVYNAEASRASEQTMRALIGDLAEGTAVPHPLSERPSRATPTARRSRASAKPKTGTILDSEVHTSAPKQTSKWGKALPSAPAAEDGAQPKRQSRARRQNQP